MASSQGWLSLPRKDQLFILIMARLSEPITQTSLQSYMYYQLKSISPAATEETLSRQAGLIQTAFTAPQICSAIIWGRLADWRGMGRKRAIILGLIGTSVATLGMGFSSTFISLICWRAIGGALNGNIGIMRTMISEVIVEKKHQSRAFLLLPMTYNVGVVIGPILGSLLANPIEQYPKLSDHTKKPNSSIQWMDEYPYALPNVVNAAFLFCAAALLFLGLDETLPSLQGTPDIGRKIYHSTRRVLKCGSFPRYTVLPSNDPAPIELESITHSNIREDPSLPPACHRKLSLKETLTRKVLSTFLMQVLQAFHLGTFNIILPVFLSTPRYTEGSSSSLDLPANYRPSYPFIFTGGLAFAPDKIGTMLAILGLFGLPLQLVVYPRLALRLGALKSYKLASLVFPVCYSLIPFLCLIQEGYLLWAAAITVLFIQTLGRVFAAPSIAILVNNSASHSSVLGTVHGMSQSLNALSRSLGPLLLLRLYGFGLSQGIVGMSWWSMAVVAIMGVLCGGLLREEAKVGESARK